MSAAVEQPLAAPQADAASQVSERLIAVLGHELRNPLAAALTDLATAVELTEEADPRASHLNRALADLDRLAGLLDRYLDFGRSQSVCREPVDLIALAERATARVVGAESSCELDSLVIDGDEILLERVLDNLLDNAIHAGAKRVQIRLGRVGKRALIDVIDDGGGVPEKLLPHLFSPFVSGGGGSGLGLAVVSDTIRAHGGSITVLPSRRGAHFRLTI